MRAILHYGFALAVMSLGVDPVLAQPVNGCPAGQAMQSSDASGRKVTCVPVTGGESDIIGTWAVTGTTSCLAATGGFNPQNFAPLVTTTPTTVSQLAGTFIGTRTFYAGGTGRSVGTSHSVTFPSTIYAVGAPSFPGGTGAASTASLDASFTWIIKPDGTLVIDDGSTIAQPFTSPPSLLGQTVTIENMPPYAGYISKDKRTIVLTHPAMSLETSVRRDASGAEQPPRSPRYCARARVLTRLP
jgi:hypothetical protein